MHWIIQNNIYEEEGFATLLETLDRFDLTRTLVKVVPFVGEIIGTDGPPLPSSGGDAIVMGSYSLARQAKKMGWVPGAFLHNLDFEVQHRAWGEWMLNADAHVCAFDAVPFQPEPFFIRPVHDTKAFTGYVEDWDGYSKWLASLRRLPESPDPENDPLGVNLMTLSTPVMVCAKKEIYSETRTWVVDGRVVTSSGFKLGTLKRYTTPDQVDSRVIDFANSVAGHWSPNEAYVLDVADTADGLKVGEVNNLNSAGWYRADLQRLVTALEDQSARSRRL